MAKKANLKNDPAWKQLFDEYDILDKVSHEGQFIISSAQINKVRESRLMTKFDQLINFPRLFSKNNLSILPISRSKYIIAPILTHQEIKYNFGIDIIEKDFPANIESLDSTDLYSEAIALNCAFNAGIIDDLMGEKTFHTISGRMSTENFSFSIDSSVPDYSSRSISVSNSQCEIDGGFEGESCFALIEAKNYTVEDFLIRQLYYPYRLWSSKLSKRVIPIFMTFSQDIFDFFVYEFDIPDSYNSLRLVHQKRYTIAQQQEEITRYDISMLFGQTQIVPEPKGIPFPQADDFRRIIDLLALLTIGDLTRDDITENYQFDERQTRYYTGAARYLGLVDKFTDPISQERTFTLTQEGRRILRRRPKQKYLGLVGRILEHEVFRKAFQVAIQQGMIPSNDEISTIIMDSQIGIGGSTLGRRATTVRGWIKWIWDQID